ncbi:hypothetical protein, partial [Methylicorpusculum sp.]|uniref:hypothetical protein n=1 Tax=Methylicorpusculum sp. TaxID=2713644 RepID=UPI002ABCCC6F
RFLQEHGAHLNDDGFSAGGLPCAYCDMLATGAARLRARDVCCCIFLNATNPENLIGLCGSTLLSLVPQKTSVQATPPLTMRMNYFAPPTDDPMDTHPEQQPALLTNN